MARTFIGELVLRLKDEMSGKAKTAANNLDTSVDRIWKEAAKDMAVYGTIGTIMYGGANAVRQGIVSNAEIMREQSRWKSANIPNSERDAAFAEADRLTTLNPCAGFLNMVELARKARAMMGDNERGLAILPDLAKLFVALQSAKGTHAAMKNSRAS